MNYALASEIYGTPWMVDLMTFVSMSNILRDSRNGVKLELPETKYNTPCLVSLSPQSKLITRSWQLENKDEFEATGLINLDGPITLSGGASSLGMEQLSQMMYDMASDSRIKNFILRINSGGGSSNAVSTMVDTINEIKKNKLVYASIKKGGMAGSAAYGIASAANKIYSESGMNIVGSAGTMIEFEGRAANTEDSEGNKLIRLYATKSVRKNEEFEQALNNNNYELLINELLDPINENFLNMIAENRPVLRGTSFEDGHTVFSKDAVGSFIDGIASFKEVIDMVGVDSKSVFSFSTNNNNSNQKLNSKNMTREELKNSHPELFQSIFQEGITAETERVASWMAYQSADPKAVAEGIASGKDIAPSQREALLIKMHSATTLQNLQADSAKPVATDAASVSEGSKEKEEVEQVNNEWLDAAKKV